MAYILEEDTTLGFTGGLLKPVGWAIHWWGDPAQNPTFDGIKSVLVNRSAAQSASVNFMCEANRVACLISPNTIAWAQGDGANGWGNNHLVSVENNPRCSAGDRETLAELIADQNIENGIPIVLYPHNKFTSTQCPGVWEKWIPSITARAKQIVIEKTTGVKAQGNEEEVAFAASEAWYNAMIQAQTRIDNAAARTYYVKGKADTIYDMTGGNVRGLTNKEWQVLAELGFTFKTVDDAKLTAFVAEYNEKHPS